MMISLGKHTFPFSCGVSYTFYLFTTVARAPRGVDWHKSRKQSEKVIDEPNLMGHIRRSIAVKIKWFSSVAFLRIVLAGDNSKKWLVSHGRPGGNYSSLEFLLHYFAKDTRARRIAVPAVLRRSSAIGTRSHCRA